jgi:hypothetical protein
VGAALCLVLSAPADAVISFVAPVSFPTTDSQNVVLGDFNKDGSLDLATADNAPPLASVLIGKGNAGFGPTVTNSLAGHPHDIRTADFNGDTNLDLAVTEQDTGRVAILPGTASGAFGSPIDVPAAGNAFALAVGDVNGDAKADLVVGDNNGAAVDVLIGNGSGGFGAPTAFALSGQAADVALADMNNDSKPDIVAVTGGAGPGVVVLAGAGDGSFATTSTAPLPAAASSVVTGHFDAENSLDVAVGLGGMGVGILAGDGQGGLGPVAIQPAGGSFATDVAVADLDGDAILDIAAVGGELITLRGKGDGTFDPAVVHMGGGVGLTVGDLDGDAKPDVVAASNEDVVVFGNNSTPPPLPAPVVAKTANVTPVKGTVLVKQPGTRRFIRLEDASHIAIGSQLDVTKGSVRLESAAGGGKTQSGVFRGGLFKLGQKKGKRPITDLTLSAKLRCVKSRRPVQASAKRPRSRQLFGDAHGRFRTRGRHSTATVRGTKWLVKDTCTTTLTVSQRGTVEVRDLVKHRTVTLKSGQRYLARRGNR